VFTPTAPIDERDLFSGRTEQIRSVIDAINQKGQHAVVFGERGVGKTSLANVLSSFLSSPSTKILAPRVNCSASDTLDTIWRKVLGEIRLKEMVKAPGLSGSQKSRVRNGSDLLQEKNVTPDGIRRVLSTLSQGGVELILIIDEFDRLPQDARRGFADTIKALSDHAVRATVVVVGVADTIDSLIGEHQSIERALVQIRMPRMSGDEIFQIINNGLKRLQMTIDANALRRIAVLSQGLPHYAHLIGLHASRAALEHGNLNIDMSSISTAITNAIDNAQHSIKLAYERAIRSNRKESLFADVLLACALAPTDDLGEFAAQEVRGPIRLITGRDYDIPSFAQHLNEFSEERRGPILQKTGSRRRFRYKFANPLMQPFVVMQGFNSHRMNDELLRSFGIRRS
jgi:Cdc6-like AAA superfamily ATPase